MNEEEMLEEETEKEPSEKDGKFDSELVNKMLATGENQEGMIQELPEEESEPLFQEKDESAQTKVGKVKQKLGKHIDAFLFDMKKNPDKYMIETPQGKMKIEDAIKRGYDPATKDFTEKPPKQAFEEMLSGLSDTGKQAIMDLSDPSKAELPPDEAAAMGLEEESPMIRGNAQPPQEETPPGIDPNMLAIMGGGM